LRVLEAFQEIYEEGDWIVSGACNRGGDLFAEKIAKDYGVPILLFPARWSHKWNADIGKFERGVLDKTAGFARNADIAGHSDVIIACVSKDRSGGTEDTIKKFDKIKEGRAWVILV
jgi:hypothetical protein